MDSEKAFRLYMATRLHFMTEYDVFESGGRFKWESKVASRKDFELINYLGKHCRTERQLIEFCVSNFLYGKINLLYDPEGTLDNFTHWNRVKESLTYSLEKDVNHILHTCEMKDVSLVEYFQKKLLNDLLSRKVEYESVILINRVTPVYEYISGFDSTKYIVRMKKADKFITKGTIATTHLAIIQKLKQKEEA